MSPSANNLQIVLVRTRNPLNIGAAARALANFGYPGLRLVAPYDPAFREARSAVGAADILASAQLFPTVADAIADCTFIAATTALKHRTPKIPTASLEQARPLIHAQLHRGPVALLFGPENSGLSNVDLSHCHLALHIPTVPAQPSMNLGQAVAVTLYELSRTPLHSIEEDSQVPDASGVLGATGGQVPHSSRVLSAKGELDDIDHPVPAAADLGRLTALLLETMAASDYPANTSPAARQRTLRQFILRLGLSAPDTTLLLGILRQILWKLHQQP